MAREGIQCWPPRLKKGSGSASDIAGHIRSNFPSRVTPDLLTHQRLKHFILQPHNRTTLILHSRLQLLTSPVRPHPPPKQPLNNLSSCLAQQFQSCTPRPRPQPSTLIITKPHTRTLSSKPGLSLALSP
jgi:hypothetical protein